MGFNFFGQLMIFFPGFLRSLINRFFLFCFIFLGDVAAIVTLKDESTRCKTRNVEPILEEFIPLKKNCEEDEKSEVEEENDTKDKMNWMSSVRLWNTDDYKNIDSEYDQKQDSVEQFIQV
ncbi:hypothetical protein U1Q18_019994 [Sarracenia purpurea var. burkii]